MSVPKQFAAGTTLSFTEKLGGYTPSAFGLAFILNLNGVLVANIPAEPLGDDFAIVVPASTTKTWTPGQYNFAELATATEGGEVTQVCSGLVSITPNFTLTTPMTSAQKALALADAAIEKLLKTPNASVNFNGQTWTKRNLKDALDARDRLQARVDAELRAAGLSNRGGAKRIATQFQ